MDTVKVHDVFEIPAHQNIDSFRRRRCDVPGICQMRSANDAGSKITLGELRGFLVKRHLFQEVEGHYSKNLTDLGWCPFELS